MATAGMGNLADYVLPCATGRNIVLILGLADLPNIAPGHASSHAALSQVVSCYRFTRGL